MSVTNSTLIVKMAFVSFSNEVRLIKNSGRKSMVGITIVNQVLLHKAIPKKMAIATSAAMMFPVAPSFMTTGVLYASFANRRAKKNKIGKLPKIKVVIIVLVFESFVLAKNLNIFK